LRAVFLMPTGFEL